MSALWTALLGGSATLTFSGLAQTQYPQGLAQYQQIAAMQNIYGMSYCQLCPHCQKLQTDAAQRFMETLRAASEQRRKVVLERIAKRKVAVLSQMSLERWN